jgi:hypothetical protein
MKKVFLALLLLLAAASAVPAQQGNTVMRVFPAGAPSGTCGTLMLAVNGTNGDLYDCISAVWTKIGSAGSGSSVGPVFNVTSAPYNVKADWRTVSDAVCSNSANTWTSATLALTQADVGKIFWARQSANQTTIVSASALSQFTVATVTNATSWTSSENTGGSNCGSSIAVFMGTDASTGLNAAGTAIHAAGKGVMYIPCGDYSLAAATFTQPTSADALTIQGGGMSGSTSGISKACTRIHVSPGVGWAAGTTTMGVNSNVLMQSIGFDGDNSNIPTVNNATLFGFGGPLIMENVSMNNFYGTGITNDVLVSESGDDNFLSRLYFRFSGGTAFQLHSLNLQCFDCIFQGSPGAQLADLGSIATFTGGAIIATAGSNALLADGASGGGVGTSFIGTSFIAGNNSVPMISVSNSNVNMRLLNPLFNNSGLNNVNLFTVASGATVEVAGLGTTGGGTGMTITNNGTLKDGCGDDPTNITVTGTVLGSCGTSGLTSLCAAVGTSANPSVVSCGAAAAGLFSCATNATGGTCQVNTSAVTTGSVIQILESDTVTTGTKLGVTCNTSTTVTPAARFIASITAGTGFVLNMGTITTNPGCFSFRVTN